MKRFLAILLVIAMLPIPATFAREAEPTVIPESAFDAVTADVWEDIEAIEAERVVATRGRKATAADYAAIVEDVIAAVEASDTYVEGSINRNGAFFSWRTTEGVACGYSPSLRARIHANAIEGADPEELAAVETTSYAGKGGVPSSMNVAVFQPYYGLDSSFKVTYSNEGKEIAQATGGTSTTYITTAATIDAIADAFETCGVVIFDSHGDTDYYNPSNENDFVSQANTSYLCLQSGDGLTSADMANVSGTYGTYQHAYYAGSSGSMKVYCVDGTAMANHMEKSSPNGLLWSAICLGMATNGLHAPLRAKGLEVAYGYSQSVSFTYDYKWEAVFWDNMIAGNNVATSIAAMKAKVGNWDYPSSYSTITVARNNYAAFPIVVSSEDTYPGKGNVDNLQTVNSTWKLKEGAAPTEPTTTPTEPTTAPSGEEYSLTTSLKDGDQVIIYNAGAGKAMSEEAVSTNYRAGVDVTVSNNKIVTDDTSIVWTVKAVTGGYMFLNDDGETLSATKGLSFATTDNVWAINAATTANSVYIVSTTATGTSGDPKTIEWYDKYTEFSTYYYSEASEGIFAMQLFSKGGSVTPTEPTTAPTEPTTAPTEPTTAPTEPTTVPSGNEYVLATSLKDGDEVVIYNASAKKAMSEDAVATNYRAGVDVTVSGNKIVTDDSKIVWKVAASGTGFTFANDAGETLSATKGLSFATTDNVWAINAASTANSVYIVSTTATGTSGDPKYVEWYDKYSEFSTYYYSEASEGIFAMQLFVKGGSTTPTEPTTAPTEPTTAPTEPTTAPTEPTSAPTEPTTAPTEPIGEDGYYLADSLKIGDKIVFVATYNDKYYAMENDAATISNALTATEVSVSGNKAIIGDKDVVWTLVSGSAAGTYLLKNKEGKYISWTSSTSIKLSDTGANFTPTLGEGTSRLTVSATEAESTVRSLIFRDNGGALQFRAYSNNNLNTTGYSGVLTIYKYTTGGTTPTEPTTAPTEPTTAPTEPTTAPTEPTTAPTEPTTAPSGNEYVLTTSLKDGDEVVIYNAGAKKAMSEDAVSTNYRAGVDVTPSGNKIVTDNSKIVWKVAASGTGFTFANDAGETLSATKGLSYATTDNVWAINAASTANSVYIVSTTATGTSGDPKYVEWYDKYTEFSTYYYSEASEAIFAMQLFVKSGSTTPTEPTTAPTEPTSAPTEPTTAPTEPTTTPTEPITGGTFVKVTAGQIDWSGKYLIVYESGDDTALVYSGSDAQNDTISVTLGRSTINYKSGMAVVTVKKCGSGYSMQLEDGTYLDSRPLDDSGKEQNGIVLSETEAELTIQYGTDGTEVIAATGSVLRYNNAASEGRFRFYKSSTYMNQQPIQLYKQTGTSPDPTEPTTAPTEPTTAPTEPTTAPTEPTTAPGLPVSDGDCVVLYNPASGLIIGYEEDTDYDESTGNYTYCNVTTEAASVSDLTLKADYENAGTFYVVVNDDGTVYFVDQYDYDQSEDPENPDYYFLAASAPDTYYDSYTDSAAFEIIPVEGGYLLKNVADNSYYAVENGVIVAKDLVEGDPSFIFQFALWEGDTEGDNTIVCTLIDTTVPPTEPTTAPTEPTTAPTEPTTAPTEPTTAPSGNEYVLTTSLKDGDEVVIYNAGAGKAMSEDAVSTNYRAGVDVTPSGNKIVTDDSKIVWTVKASGSGFIFSNDAGETLSATKGLSFATTDNVWAVNAAKTANSVYLVSTTAVGTSGDPKYVEWYDKYSEFSTYYYSEASEGIFAMQLFVRSGSVTPTEPTTAPTEPTTAPTEPTTAPTEPTTAPTEPTEAPDGSFVLSSSIKAGDQVVIYSPGHGMAIKDENDNNWYLVAQAITPTGNKIYDPDASLVWTVVDNGDGTFSFKNGADQIVMWVSGNYFEMTNDPTYAGADGKWKVSWTDGLAYIQHATFSNSYGPAYIECYYNSSKDKTNISGYSTSDPTAKAKDFGFQFFVKKDAITPTEPTTAPTEPTTAPTEPTTGPVDPTATVYYTITWYVEGKAYREQCAKGEMPVFHGSTDKPDDEEYTYTFAGWQPNPVPAYADATYIATYTKEPIHSEDTYIITWVVGDREYTEKYTKGEMPVFTGSTDKPDDDKYIYCFAGWSPAIEKVTKNATYFAQYTRIPLHNVEDFLDVPENMWCYEEVNRSAQIGLFNGISYRHFDPNGAVSRAMVVTVLYRMEGEPEVKYGRTFSDVPEDRWYSDAVLWASNVGIAKGISDNVFAPNDPVTREQFAAFLYRYAEWKGYDLSARGKLSVFTDRNKLSDYAEDAMYWAVGCDLFRGMEQNGKLCLNPQGTATRAQAASIMVRFFNAFIK